MSFMAEILPTWFIDLVGLIDAMNQRTPRAAPPGAHETLHVALYDDATRLEATEGRRNSAMMAIFTPSPLYQPKSADKMAKYINPSGRCGRAVLIRDKDTKSEGVIQ
jgi:hypothetical protein